MKPTEMRDLLASCGASPTHSLGQNFLIDEKILDRISALPAPGANVLEIGAGAGHLTARLCEHVRRVVTVEIDRTLAPVLAKTVTAANHTFLWQDILKTDTAEVSRRYFEDEPFYLVGNLPYNITSDIIERLCRDADRMTGAALMVQKEAADRLCAGSGAKNYRASSVLAQYFFDILPAFKVPADCFYPAPHIESAVILLDPHFPRPLPKDREKAFGSFVKAAFSARRKKLTHLAPSLGMTKEAFSEKCRAAGVSPDARCETLSPVRFAALFRILQEK